jgi:two-component system, LuxR family, response regulator FixJ
MTSATPTKPVVHVIDDDEAVRDSLAFLLRSAELSVATYENAVAFLQGLPPQGPACIVTDVRMPEIGGIDLLRRLRERNVTTPVIVITGHGDVPLAVEAMKLGAADFLEKPFSDESLLGAVRAALAVEEGNSRRGAELAAINEKLASLSNRERQVLEGLVSGQPNKSIAYDLQISPRTVEIYRANLMTKMNASSLSELVRMALLAGVLDSASSSPAEQSPTK